MPTREELRLRAEMRGLIEEAEFGLGDMSRGVDPILRRSTQSSNSNSRANSSAKSRAPTPSATAVPPLQCDRAVTSPFETLPPTPDAHRRKAPTFSTAQYPPGRAESSCRHGLTAGASRERHGTQTSRMPGSPESRRFYPPPRNTEPRAATTVPMSFHPREEYCEVERFRPPAPDQYSNNYLSVIPRHQTDSAAVGARRLSGLWRPRNDGAQGPWVPWGPAASRPQNNDPQQYPTEGAMSPWSGPMPEAWPAFNAEPASSTQSGPTLQSVQAVRAVETVAVAQDLPDAQAAQTLRASSASTQVSQTQQVIQALEDVQDRTRRPVSSLAASPNRENRERRRLQTRREPPPNHLRGLSWLSSCGLETTSAQEKVILSRDHLEPNHPEGYPQPPPFRHNRVEPNRRAAGLVVDHRCAIRAGDYESPIGSAPNPDVSNSESQRHNINGQGSQNYWGHNVGRGHRRSHSSVTQRQSAIEQEQMCSSPLGNMMSISPYEMETAAAMQANEASLHTDARQRAQAQEEPPDRRGFVYWDHTEMPEAESPTPTVYGPGVVSPADLMSADEAAVAAASLQRLTLMIDRGFDCPFG